MKIGELLLSKYCVYYYICNPIPRCVCVSRFNIYIGTFWLKNIFGSYVAANVFLRMCLQSLCYELRERLQTNIVLIIFYRCCVKNARFFECFNVLVYLVHNKYIIRDPLKWKQTWLAYLNPLFPNVWLSILSQVVNICWIFRTKQSCLINEKWSNKLVNLNWKGGSSYTIKGMFDRHGHISLH